VWRIKYRKQKADIGKYYSVNITKYLWNQLPAVVSMTLFCEPSKFRKRIRKVKSEVWWK
jgi:hypothetical protein